MERLGGNDVGSATGVRTFSNSARDGLSDLGTANDGWLNGIRIVRRSVADEPKIDDSELLLHGNANDGIVESSQGNNDALLITRFREVAVIYGADHQWQPGLETSIHDSAIGRLELADRVGQEQQCLAAGRDRRLKHLRAKDRVVSADAEQQVRGAQRKLGELSGYVLSGGTVYRLQCGLPTDRQGLPDVSKDSRTAFGIGAIVENRIAKEDEVVHFLRPSGR